MTCFTVFIESRHTIKRKTSTVINFSEDEMVVLR